MTQKQILESVLSEIKHIKTHMPNGELKQMMKDMQSMKDDITDLKFTLLNPENGVIVENNKNSDYRKELQGNEAQFRDKLAEIDDMKYRYYKNFKSVPATQDSLEETLPKTSDEYNGKVTETRLENYKNFFSNSFVEDIDMSDNTLTIRKKFSDPVHFDFVDIGDINNIYETVEGKFDLMESYPEILFLTKYFGDYNISKYGDNFVFENQGKGLVLKRI